MRSALWQITATAFVIVSILTALPAAADDCPPPASDETVQPAAAPATQPRDELAPKHYHPSLKFDESTRLRHNWKPEDFEFLSPNHRSFREFRSTTRPVSEKNWERTIYDSPHQTNPIGSIIAIVLGLVIGCIRAAWSLATQQTRRR